MADAQYISRGNCVEFRFSCSGAGKSQHHHFEALDISISNTSIFWWLLVGNTNILKLTFIRTVKENLFGSRIPKVETIIL